ncbi:CpsD/CapB family tyrosine-protein kinase [Oceanicella actignis]|uniref:CpsD/CapB family tyrosine-protein kinase n=1 Tax=Oceanicella actignis TaxID=1189325 RepID=UPI0011E739E9|nr:CpsD/CapB family tyrosine-protein kinase [Oceanicella actignis]
MERIKAAIAKARMSREDAPAAARRPREVARPRSGRPAAWDRLEQFTPDPARLERARIVTHAKEDPAHVPFDILRTRLMKMLERNGWTSVAITSPTKACGKTLIACNLALSFARQKAHRTVLADMDLKRPMLGEVLGLRTERSVGDWLSGEASVTETFRCVGDSLAVGVNRQPFRNSAELIQDPVAAEAIAAMKDELRPDVVIYDLPPVLASDDALSFAQHVDAVLLIASAGQTKLNELAESERLISDMGTLGGVILNRYDLKSENYYEYDYVY